MSYGAWQEMSIKHNYTKIIFVGDLKFKLNWTLFLFAISGNAQNVTALLPTEWLCT